MYKYYSANIHKRGLFPNHNCSRYSRANTVACTLKFFSRRYKTPPLGHRSRKLGKYIHSMIQIYIGGQTDIFNSIIILEPVFSLWKSLKTNKILKKTWPYYKIHWLLRITHADILVSIFFPFHSFLALLDEKTTCINKWLKMTTAEWGVRINTIFN